MAELSVATFNTHWGVDMCARPFDVVQVCRGLDADVLVLQECWRPFGRPAYVDQIAVATGATLRDVTFMSDRNRARPRHLAVTPDGPAGTCGLAVLSRLPVLAWYDVPLPHVGGDVVHRRHSLVATLDVGGTPVTIGAVHASHRLWGSLPQLRRVDRELAAIGAPNAIVGDCNMWGPPIAAVLRGRRRAVRGRTWPAWGPHSQIDHVWVGPDLEPIDPWIGRPVGSDHLPVRVTLRVA